MTLGGEYVRGDPSIWGDLKPVGDALEGKGKCDLIVATGVPEAEMAI